MANVNSCSKVVPPVVAGVVGVSVTGSSVVVTSGVSVLLGMWGERLGGVRGIGQDDYLFLKDSRVKILS